MKQKVKLKGHLKAYFQTALILGILLVLVDAGIYFLDLRAGICVSGFLLVYLITMLILLYRNKSIVMNEFMETMNLSIEQAMDALRVPPEERDSIKSSVFAG